MPPGGSGRISPRTTRGVEGIREDRSKEREKKDGQGGEGSKAASRGSLKVPITVSLTPDSNKPGLSISVEKGDSFQGPVDARALTGGLTSKNPTGKSPLHNSTPIRLSKKEAPALKVPARENKESVSSPFFADQALTKLQSGDAVLVGELGVQVIPLKGMASADARRVHGLRFISGSKNGETHFFRVGNEKGTLEVVRPGVGRETFPPHINGVRGKKGTLRNGDYLIIDGKRYQFFSPDHPAEALKATKVNQEIHRQRDNIQQIEAKLADLKNKLKASGNGRIEILKEILQTKKLLDSHKAELEKFFIENHFTKEGVPFSIATYEFIPTLTAGILKGAKNIKVEGSGINRASRNMLRAQAIASLEKQGLKLSSDNNQAIDSIIDLAVIAKRLDIIDKPGGLTAEQFNFILAELFRHGNLEIQISNVELTHVPMVVEGTTYNIPLKEMALLLRAKRAEDLKVKVKSSPPTPVEMRRAKVMAYLLTVLHDAGKHQGANLRTVEGFSILGTSVVNPLNVDIPVKAGETLAEAVERITLAKVREPGESIAEAALRTGSDVKVLMDIRKKLQEIRQEDSETKKLKNELPTLEDAANALHGLAFLNHMGILIGIVAHHESLSVHDFITKTLVDKKILLESEAEVLWSGIPAHGIGSPWIGKQSLGGYGIHTPTFEKIEHREFLNLYLKGGMVDLGGRKIHLDKGLAIEILTGNDVFKTKDPVLKAAVAKLRSVYQSLPPQKRIAIILDLVGQPDPAKYLTAVRNSPFNKNSNLYDLFLGPHMENQTYGVLKYHAELIRLLDPKLYEKVGPHYEVTLNWMRETNPEVPGLAQGLLSDPQIRKDYQEFKEGWEAFKNMPEGSLGDLIKDYMLLGFKWDNPFHDFLRSKQANVDGKSVGNIEAVQPLISQNFYHFRNVTRDLYDSLVEPLQRDLEKQSAGNEKNQQKPPRTPRGTTRHTPPPIPPAVRRQTSVTPAGGGSGVTPPPLPKKPAGPVGDSSSKWQSISKGDPLYQKAPREYKRMRIVDNQVVHEIDRTYLERNSN